MNRPLPSRRLLFLLPALMASAALAAGPRSTLVNAAFIDGANIVSGTLPELKEFAGVLRQVATAAGGSCQKSEYVVWDSAAGLENQFKAGLKTLGYTYTLLDSDDEDGHVAAFRLNSANTAIAGVWADSDGTTLLGWCSLKLAQAAPTQPRPAPANSASTAKTPWPAFGAFKVGDQVQIYTASGWRQGVVQKVGPQPGKGVTTEDWAAEKKYLILRPDINDLNWEEWGNVAHLGRAPYWTGFFVGDWTVGEMMAVNTTVSGSTETTNFSYLAAGEALRIKAEGTYEWKDGQTVTRGRWQAAPDGPGVVVKDAKGRSWTLRNQTNLTTEKIRKLESARLYPNDTNQLSKAASRPLGR